MFVVVVENVDSVEVVEDDVDGVFEVEEVATVVVVEINDVDDVVDVEEVVLDAAVEVVVVVDDMMGSRVLTLDPGMSLQHVGRNSLIINQKVDVFNCWIESGILLVNTFFQPFKQ